MTYRQRFKTEAQRFWEKVQKSPGCWIWTGAGRKSRRYGHLWFRGKQQQAHHAARLSGADVHSMRESGLPAAQLAIQYGVSRSQAYRILNGQRWKSVA